MHAFVFWKLKDKEEEREERSRDGGKEEEEEMEGERKEEGGESIRFYLSRSLALINRNNHLLNKEEDEASGQLAAALTKLVGLLGSQVRAWEASAPSQSRAASLLVCGAPATVPGIQTQSIAGTAVSAVLGNQPLLLWPPLLWLLPQSIPLPPSSHKGQDKCIQLTVCP